MKAAMRILAVAVMGSVGASGCSGLEHHQTADTAATKFHAEFNARHCSAIYSSAAPTFRSETKEVDFVAYCDAIQRKLGNFKRAEPGTWQVNSNGAGVFVNLSYASEFDQGSGTESFTFVISGGQPLLFSYTINSRELVVK